MEKTFREYSIEEFKANRKREARNDGIFALACFMATFAAYAAFVAFVVKVM